ncbi:MAG: cobalt-precorrin-6A reductase [Rhodospirillales bacterium]
MPDRHLLILGGTQEARELAALAGESLAGRIRVTTSLAGRRPQAPPLSGEVRLGGFGGVEGLVKFLADNAVDLMVDATHPFSSTMSDHASAAATAVGVPRLQLRRPPWTLPPAADWIEVDGLVGAAEVLPKFARRVFLTTGARGLEVFSDLDTLWFLVRLIDPAAEPPPLTNHQVITGTPPYALKHERAVLAEHDIDTLVSKHAGGDATAAKITAAAEAGVKIVLIRRPPPEPGPVAETVADALAWVEGQV